jgi:gluconate kinase
MLLFTTFLRWISIASVSGMSMMMGHWVLHLSRKVNIAICAMIYGVLCFYTQENDFEALAIFFLNLAKHHPIQSIILLAIYALSIRSIILLHRKDNGISINLLIRLVWMRLPCVQWYRQRIIQREKNRFMLTAMLKSRLFVLSSDKEDAKMEEVERPVVVAVERNGIHQFVLKAPKAKAGLARFSMSYRGPSIDCYFFQSIASNFDQLLPSQCLSHYLTLFELTDGNIYPFTAVYWECCGKKLETTTCYNVKADEKMNHFYDQYLCSTLLSNINELSAATGTLPFNSIKTMCEMAPHLTSLIYRGHGHVMKDEKQTSQLDTKEPPPQDETSAQKRQRLRREQEQQKKKTEAASHANQSFHLCLVHQNHQNLGVVKLF